MLTGSIGGICSDPSQVPETRFSRRSMPFPVLTFVGFVSNLGPAVLHLAQAICITKTIFYKRPIESFRN
jgi:hypothetical protein